MLKNLFHIFRVTISGSFTAIAAAGQVATDGTMGTATTLTGPNYTISQDLGTTVGNNLFHSFGTFNLSQGDVANFTGADTIQNVISHVTDGNPSSIDGTIQSQIGTANFFFINPAGIVFGQHAAVDVPSAFHASTANELRFADGTAYNLVTPKGSLTAAPPEAFGFLGKTGDIRIENGQLTFREGTNVTFAGGSIVSNNSIVTAPRGTLHIYGQGDTVGTIPINGELPAGNGAITINDGEWNVSGNGGGNIQISGGAVQVINDALIFSDNDGASNANGGINIQANTLLVDAGLITADTYNFGNGGVVTIIVNGELQILNSGVIGSDVYGGSGNAGTVAITAGSLIINGNGASYPITGILSTTADYNGNVATGNAGQIIIDVAGEIRIINGGNIISGTWSSGHGQGGTITINAENIIIDGYRLLDIFTGITANSGDEELASNGDAGNIIINVSGNMHIINFGSIMGMAFGDGNAGSVQITIDGILNINNGTVSTSTKNSNGGPIEINASVLTLLNGLVTTSSYGAGLGGNISIHSNYLVMDNGFIQANTKEGIRGGNILIDVTGILPNGGMVAIGGKQREAPVLGKNVIQAAAPGGESGIITLANPNDDTATSIAVNANRHAPVPMAKNLCEEIKKRGSLQRKRRSML